MNAQRFRAEVAVCTAFSLGVTLGLLRGGAGHYGVGQVMIAGAREHTSSCSFSESMHLLTPQFYFSLSTGSICIIIIP